MKIKTNTSRKDTESGFTLVELSIVVVIIGLLVAGVMAGQSLVKSSKLQNVIKELREYDTAIKQFKEKFKYYPGDLPTATTYWGAYAAGPPITGASNGDGNWQLSYNLEVFLGWRHLTLAGFVPGTYSSVTGAYTPNSNVPGTQLNPSGFYFFQYFPVGGGIVSTSGNTMGLATEDCAGCPWGKIISGQDAQVIDIKIDDGKPATGNLYANDANNTPGGTCASEAWNFAGDPTTVTYTLTNTDTSCRLWWWLDKNK